MAKKVNEDIKTRKVLDWENLHVFILVFIVFAKISHGVMHGKL